MRHEPTWPSHQFRAMGSRIVLWLGRNADTDEICARVATTFGVVNFSCAVETALDVDAIRAAAVARVAVGSFTSFRVSTRRGPIRSPNAPVGISKMQ